MSGFVYCIGRDFGLVKIGYSAKLPSRVKNLQAGNPQRLEIIGCIPGDFQLERLVQEQFAHLRVGGEWFRDEEGAISSFFNEADAPTPLRLRKDRGAVGEFYRTFRDQWPAFLRAHFRNSAHVAAFFQADDKTARDWLAGTTQPRGQVVAYAVAAMPAQAGKLLGAAA